MGQFLNTWFGPPASLLTVVVIVGAPFERKFHWFRNAARWVKAQTLGRLRAPTEALEEEIKRLKQELDSVRQRQTVQDVQFKAINALVAAMSLQPQEQQDAVKRLQQQVDTLATVQNDDIVGIHERVDATILEVERQDGEIKNLQKKEDNLNFALEKFGDEIIRIGTSVEGLDRKEEEQARLIAAVNRKVNEHLLENELEAPPTEEELQEALRRSRGVREQVDRKTQG